MGGRGAGSGSGKASAKSYYDYDDRSESNAVLSADGETWWNSLTQKNKDFYEFYTGSGYTGFNEAARDADGDSKKMPKYGKRLDAAIETLGRGNLDRNMIFNRQSTLSLLGLKKGASDADMQACVGKVVVDHGITSTRASKYHNDGKGMFGNTNVDKWQTQDATKSAAFLASVHNSTDYSQYPDKYGFYEGDYQKFSLRMGLNKPPTVLSEKEFNDVVKKNNLQVLYRGEAGNSQVDRFMTAKYSHTGVGYYGDGFYFSQNKGVANSYAQQKGGIDGRVVKMALSPTARVITHKDLMKRWNALPKKLQSALTKQGKNSGSGYYNKGEAQLALKLGYNVVTDCGYGNNKHYALTRDAFIVCDTVKHKW